MRVIREGGQIVLRDRPGPFWALGLLLLSGGALALLMPLGVAYDSGDLAPWERVACVALGLAVGAGGIWWLNRSIATRAELDLTHQRLTLVRLGLSGRRVVRLQLSDIAGVEAERGTDGDGGAIWRAMLRLRDGQRIALSELWSHDEKEVKQAVAILAQACA